MTKEEFLKKWKQYQYDNVEDMLEEDLKDIGENVLKVKLRDIETIPYLGKAEKVEYKTKELVARCPMTGLPDFYRLRIVYVPNRVVPELKSLKLYLYDYFDLPIIHEHLATKIYDDFMGEVSPKSCYLCIKAARRGGIDTTIETGDPSLK